MIDAPVGETGSLAAFGDGNQGGGDVGGGGGRTVLVGNDAEAVALAAEAEHGFDEVAAVRAEHPGGAQDDVARTGCGGLFACQLAFAVHALRVDGIGFAVGCLGRAVEHIIGGNVQ